jgi:hypothetical protein
MAYVAVIVPVPNELEPGASDGRSAYCANPLDYVWELAVRGEIDPREAVAAAWAFEPEDTAPGWGIIDAPNWHTSP